MDFHRHHLPQHLIQRFLAALSRLCTDLQVRLAVRLILFLGLRPVELRSVSSGRRDLHVLYWLWVTDCQRVRRRVRRPCSRQGILRARRREAMVEALRRRYPMLQALVFTAEGSRAGQRFLDRHVRQALLQIGWTGPTETALLRRTAHVRAHHAWGLSSPWHFIAGRLDRASGPRYRACSAADAKEQVEKAMPAYSKRSDNEA